MKPISRCVADLSQQVRTNCYHLVTNVMTVRDLLQVVPTRLIQAVCNKLLCELVINLLRADNILLEQLVVSLLISDQLRMLLARGSYLSRLRKLPHA